MVKHQGQNEKKENLKKKWCWLKTDSSWQEYAPTRNDYNQLIRKRKREYYHQKIDDAGHDQRKFYRVIKGLTRQMESKFPERTNDKSLTDDFLHFLRDKIEHITMSFQPMKLISL